MKSNKNCKAFQIEDLCDLLAEAAERYSDRTAVVYHNGYDVAYVKYAELKSDVNRVCDMLREKKVESQYVILCGDYSYYWILSFFAILCIGSAAVCISPGAVIPEQFQESFVICDETSDMLCDGRYLSYAEIAMGLDEIRSQCDYLSDTKCSALKDNPAAVLFTSGTTGDSKPVTLTHKNLSTDVMACQYLLKRTCSDRVLSLPPIYHALGLTAGLLTVFYIGGQVCIPQGVKYLIKNLKEYEPTILIAVPAIVRTLVRYASAAYKGVFENGKVEGVFGGRLNTVVCGGAALDNGLCMNLSRLGFKVLNGYGITECSPVISCSTDETPIGSVGKPSPFCEVKLIDEEIAVRGPIVAIQSLPDKNNHMKYKDGWFLTGDLGAFDDDGNLFVTGRKKDLLVLESGENISPECIERIITTIPHVSEAVVFEYMVYDGIGGIAAAIYPDEEYLKKDDVFLENFFLSSAAKLKMPHSCFLSRVFICRERFPNNSLGKLRRAAVKEMFVCNNALQK